MKIHLLVSVSRIDTLLRPQIFHSAKWALSSARLKVGFLHMYLLPSILKSDPLSLLIVFACLVQYSVNKT